MTRCKYYQNNESPSSGFDLAREGFFLGIGSINGDSVALIQDRLTGKLGYTYLDYTQLIESNSDVLIDELMKKIRLFLPVKRHQDMEGEIRKIFAKHGNQ